MELLGEKLKSVRIAKNISLDKAEEETRISKNYLEALENNEFDKLPGETYILGFIRNYAGFLGLSQDEMVKKYRNAKIQEMPTPVKELLSNKKPFPVLKFLISVISVIVIVVMILTIYLIIDSYKKSEKPIQSEPQKSGSSIIEFNGQFLEQNFISGNKISFIIDNDLYIITINSINKNYITINSEFGKGKIEKEITVKLNENFLIDFDENKDPDIRIYLKTISEDQTSSQIRFDKSITMDMSSTVADSTETIIEKSQDIIKPVVEQAIEIKNSNEIDEKNSIVVLTSSEIKPFFMVVSFREGCYVQHIADKEEVYSGSYFYPGKKLRIDASNSIKIALSNGGAAYATINGIEVSLGNFGTVVSKKIGWRKNSATEKFELFIRDLK